MTNRWYLVALALAGCVGAELETSALHELEGDDNCNPLICPGNSDLIALLGPYELDETGQEFSSRGFRIASITHLGVPVESFSVPGPAPLAVRKDGVRLRGAALVGLKLTLEYRLGGTFELEIDAHLPTLLPYYAGGPSRLEGFHVVQQTQGEPVEICPYSDHPADHGVLGNWTVFWKGDRVEPATGLIFASDDAVGPWFNVSCAGEATIKMMRARTGGAVAPSSPVAQRQATLNMFTASYCGPTGQRYTKLGEQIAWSDLSGPSDIGGANDIESYEAVWTADGAECIGVPRKVALGEIGCAIRTCTHADIGNWESVGLLLSGNPL